jgi:hypothetical protein
MISMRVVLAALVALSSAGAARAQATRRFEGALFSFAYPADAAAAASTDVAADVAVSVESKELRASVLASARRVPDAELDELAEKWHSARIRNRAAWGMKAHGGPPRELVRVDERRWLRWRDRIGSVLGAQEQTMTCGAVGGHLSCVVVIAPSAQRDAGDALAAQLLSSLTLHHR